MSESGGGTAPSAGGLRGSRGSAVFEMGWDEDVELVSLVWMPIFVGWWTSVIAAGC